MAKKIITGVAAAVLLITIAVFAAEKAKEKVLAEKPEPNVKADEQCMQGNGPHERLLDELVEAYKANDREKMGQIINKMQERREKMREFVKLNRWHRWAHRMMMWRMGHGWGQQMGGPWGMAGGPGWHRGWAMQGQAWNQGCPMWGPRGQFQTMRGREFGGFNNMRMGNWEAVAGPQNEAMMGWGCGPGFFNRMGNCGPMCCEGGQMPCRQNNAMQMRGCGQGFQQGQMPCQQGNMNMACERQQQCEDNMGAPRWNMPRHERQNNVPPAEWGW